MTPDMSNDLGVLTVLAVGSVALLLVVRLVPVIVRRWVKS